MCKGHKSSYRDSGCEMAPNSHSLTEIEFNNHNKVFTGHTQKERTLLPHS